MITHKISQGALSLIKQYQSLCLGDKNVCTPYYRNVKRERAGLRALIGKGTPEEIVLETNIFAKLRGFNLQNASIEEIRKFMILQGIGIDCSGFVSHILLIHIKEKYNLNLFWMLKYQNISLLRRIIQFFRPIENISAKLLTNEFNCQKIDLLKVQPGDLIRLKGLKKGHHIAIITQVNYKNNKINSFCYAHTSEYYGENNGVREGMVKLIDHNIQLHKQEWLEKDDDQTCYTLKQLILDLEDNGLRRLKFIPLEK